MIQAADTTMCWGDDHVSGFAGRTLPRQYWTAYCWNRGPERTPIQYSRELHRWYSDEGVSIPWAVMDDYGALVAVPYEPSL